ncbi:PilW family protein [Niveibacterium terrae]|uniref:PilW family protein n=1 Tax=Niveibacterium terrae TaxID=3373598 RepID=UPI003A90D8C8
MSFAPDRIHREAGFTLIELMISLVLGLIVMGSAVAVLASQRGSARLTTQGADIQGEGRIAVDALSRALRGAGDFGCWPVSNPINKLKTTTAFNEANGGVEGLDKDGTLTDLTGYGAGQLSSMNIASDVVGITGITSVLTETTTAMANSNSDLTVKNSRQSFSDGDVAVISNCINWTKFQITTATPGEESTTLKHEAGDKAGTAGGGNSASDLGDIYGVGSSVGKLDTVWWFVGQPEGKPRGLYQLSGMGGLPVLISARVQDIHLSYDIDTNADGIVDQPEQTAAQVKTAGNWAKVRAAHVEVLMRSDKSVPTQAIKYTFRGAQVTPTDRAVYLALSQTVALRNTQ